MSPEELSRLQPYDPDHMAPKHERAWLDHTVPLTTGLCWIAASLVFGFIIGWSIPW